MQFRAPGRRRRRHRGRHRRHPGVRLLAMLAVALLIAACGGDDDPDDAGPVTVGTEADTDDSAPDTTTSTTQDPEAALIAEVEAAYEEISAAYLRIVSDPDPGDPEIGEYYAGESLEKLVASTNAFRDSGLAVRLPDNRDDYRRTIEEVRLVGSDSAEIEVCVVDGAVIYRVEDGVVLDDDVVVSRNVMTVVLDGGRWRSQSYVRLAEGEAAGC